MNRSFFLVLLFVTLATSRASIGVGPWVPIFKGIDHATGQMTPDGVDPRIQAVNALRIDLADPDVQTFTDPPCADCGSGFETIGYSTSSFLRTYGVQVAVNANIFIPCCFYADGIPMDVVGLSISNGRMVSQQEGPIYSSSVMFTTNKQVIMIATNWPPTNTDGIYTAVSGTYPLVANGLNIGYTYAGLPDSIHQVQPRTAVGVSQDGRYLYLVTIDGRQLDYSDGAIDSETADWLIRFGSYNGINLDGGGSVTMVMADSAGNPIELNQPSDFPGTGLERVIANHLGVFAKPLPIAPVPPTIKSQPQSQIAVAGRDATFSVAAGGTAPLNYQWQFNGSNIAAATNPMLAISNAHPTNSGNYTVVVANNYGAVTSAVATLTVNFALTVNVDGAGSVSRSPDLASYLPNSLVMLTAVPSAGYAFAFWSGDGGGRRNPLAVTMSTNKIITANFVLIALVVTNQGPGSVGKSPDKPIYNVGDQVTLVATTATTAARWFGFTGWADGGTNNPRRIIIGANNNYTAIFSPTTAVETLTFGGVSRTTPVGMPAIFVDGDFVVTNLVIRRGGARIALQTSFPNGTMFYTLDGSPPTLVSILYHGPFELGRSATIRAAAWDANFSRFWEADPVRVVIEPVYSLTASTFGGGTIAVTPTNGPYLSNTVVMLAARPASGWSFLQWLGDAAGGNPTSSVVMTRDKCVQAVFGTTLNTAVAGSGSVALHPAAALYPYGTAVTLTAVPQAGNFFAVWGNAVSSTNNPLRFVVTNANPTISAAFIPLDADQFALTVIANGRGQVTVSPRANRYNHGQGVTLTAAPDSDQALIGWSGDASGTQNPLFVMMTQSKIITAKFTKRPRLDLVNCPGAFNGESFQVSLTGEFGAVYEIDQSSDLVHWSVLSLLTNSFGTAQFSDPFAANITQRFYRAAPAPAP